MNAKQVLLCICAAFLMLPAQAQVELGPLFTNNMVIQQLTDAPIWGKCTPNKTVKIVASWDNKEYRATADSKGKWSTYIKTPAAGGPYTIIISEENSNHNTQLRNVMAGDVWICSGQSNMQFPMKGWDTGAVANYNSERARARYKNIRFLQIKQNITPQPTDDYSADNDGWVECTPKNVEDFSAVAYFFGRDMYQHLNIPIGLIHTSWGGTVAESWTSADGLKAFPEFKRSIKKSQKSKASKEEMEAQYNKAITKWNNQLISKDAGFHKGKPIWATQTIDTSSWRTMNIPDVIDDQGLSSFDGVIWFRKEINIPADWSGKDLKLGLGLIDDADITYFNGVEVGHTDKFDLTRSYTIPASLVKAGTAIILVRVLDTGSKGGFYGSFNSVYIESPTMRESLAGNWKAKTTIDLNKFPPQPHNTSSDPNSPTLLFNAMIHPLVPYAIKGAIWYQGEANTNRAYQYQTLFPAMITDWRKQWKSDFPFYYVQLANYNALQTDPTESDWAELREAQTKTLSLKNTGMAVTIDIGEAGDIHPKNKQDVGYRLSLQARAHTYNDSIEASGPMMTSYKIEGSAIRITFTHTAKGLETHNGTQEVHGFTIAGSDHKFHWATARIEGNDVVVSCPEVPSPVAVRYAWANNPICNLFNSIALPACPFRTDDWDGITKLNK